MIHCGSRGLGHQVASDFIETMENAFGVAGLPDRELVHAPFRSRRSGQRYYRAMCAAVNFAFANRQMIAHWVRDVFARVLGQRGGHGPGLRRLPQRGQGREARRRRPVEAARASIARARRGASVRAGPRSRRPTAAVGQPVIIPGSMGTASYVLAGTTEAEALSFGSTAHGAGRVMSRHEALRRFRGEKIRDDLARRGIELQSTSWKGVAEEASGAYKDVDEVVRVSNEVGLGRVVAKLVPIGVMKG